MRYLIVVISFLFSIGLSAQVLNSLIVSADTILIGDEITVLHRVIVPSDIELQGIDYSPLIDGLKTQNMFNGEEQDADAFWMGKYENYENKIVPTQALTLHNQNGKKLYTDTLTLSLYQAGRYILPNPTPILDTTRYEAEIIDIESPTVAVMVTKTISDFLTAAGDSLSPEKIKAGMVSNVSIIKTDKVWQDYIWHVLIPLVLLIMALIAFYIIRKRQKEANRVWLEKPTAPADYHARQRLKKIEEEQLWKHGKEKVYQSDLTYMIREYLENRYNIKALESTTEEIKKALKGQVTIVQETELIEILQIADLVKFAKAQPSEDINESFLKKAKSFVESTRVDDADFVESEYDKQLIAYEQQQLLKKK